MQSFAQRPALAAAFRQHVAAWGQLLVGLAVFSTGLALMVRAELGLSSWDVLHDAIAQISALSFGTAIVVISVAVVVGSALLGIRPGPGTVANLLLVGIITDSLLATGSLTNLASVGLVARSIALLVGVGAIAFGTALYISADLGAGPRDSLMLACARRLRVSPGRARTMLELSVLMLGVALGGRAGAGTLAFALLVGPAVDVSFALLGRGQRVRSPLSALRSARDSFASWLRNGQLGSGSGQREIARQTGVRG